MKVWKKVLSLVLACSAVLSSFAAGSLTVGATEKVNPVSNEKAAVYDVGDAAVDGIVNDEDANAEFEDVTEGAYFYESVMWAVENKVTSGLSASVFGVGQPCTREQVVTLLWNYAGQPKAENNYCTFEDVNPNHYYYNAMLWAIEQGLVSGYDADTFGVGDPCTREQIVFILWKYEGAPEPNMKNCKFKDANPLHYYYTAMRWTVSAGIVSGYNATTFGVGDSCTREQIVTFLYRAYADVPEFSIVGKWNTTVGYLDYFGDYLGADIDPFMDYDSVMMKETFVFAEDGTYTITLGMDAFIASVSAMLENGFDQYVKFIVKEAALEGEIVSEAEVWELIGMEKGNVFENLGYDFLREVPTTIKGQYRAQDGKLYISEDVTVEPSSDDYETYVVTASTLLITGAYENGKYVDSAAYPIYLTKVL